MLDVRSSICYNFCKALCEGLVNKDGYIDEVDAHMKGPRGLILKGKGHMALRNTNEKKKKNHEFTI